MAALEGIRRTGSSSLAYRLLYPYEVTHDREYNSKKIKIIDALKTRHTWWKQAFLFDAKISIPSSLLLSVFTGFLSLLIEN